MGKNNGRIITIKITVQKYVGLCGRITIKIIVKIRRNNGETNNGETITLNFFLW